ncbi:kinase [Thraustotheca clavata]|uniref:Kinase n=1 Tax=Thraustotheca clavata TaxID=74557 RepID=A0A1V9Z5S6_9STRA|nr:kinase [Thraustotheca clavata]
MLICFSDVVNNSIQSVIDHDWRSLQRLNFDKNPLETLAYIRLSAQSFESFSCLNCRLTNITIDSKTADAFNALEKSNVYLNSNVLTNASRCDAIGGTIQQILTKQTNYTITACVIPIVPYAWIIVGSICGVVAIALAAFFYIRHKKKIKQRELHQEQPYIAFDAIDIQTTPSKNQTYDNNIIIAQTQQPTEQTIEYIEYDSNNIDSSSQTKDITRIESQQTKHSTKSESTQSSNNTDDNQQYHRRIAPLVDPTPIDLDMSHLRPYRLELVDLYILSNKPLASGAFGEVWLGTYGREQIAIKRLKSRQLKDVQSFINEIVLLAQLDCSYIVKLIGASWTRPIDVECVLEYMDLGDLRNYLVKYSPTQYTWEQKYQSIMSIVQGLVYLHTYHVPIVHRDLKSRNVLLDSVKGTKITDFGTSRVAELDDTMTNGVGTYQWMAPEVISSTRYSTQADVYSFGIILSEFCTHQVPFANLRHPQTNNVMPQHYFMQQVCAGVLYPSFEGENVPSWVEEVAMQCLRLNGDDRPTALDLAAILQRFKP